MVPFIGMGIYADREDGFLIASTKRMSYEEEMILTSPVTRISKIIEETVREIEEVRVDEPEQTPHNCPECGSPMERKQMSHSDGTPSNEYCYCCGRCGITVFPEYFKQQAKEKIVGHPARTRLEILQRRRKNGVS